MELNKKTVKTILLIIFSGLLMAVALWNMTGVVSLFNWIFGLLLPFILGGCIAFILNIPMSIFERRILSEKWMHGKFSKKMRRPLSLLMALILVIAILCIVVFLVVPEIGHTVSVLANEFPAFIGNVQSWINNLAATHPDVANQLLSLSVDWSDITRTMGSFFQKSITSFVGSTFNMASSVLGGLLNFFIGFIFAIYILLQKEVLGRQIGKLMYAFMPEKRVKRTLAILALTNRTFGNFITGQCTEAVILGSMFFITLALFRIPYALMISVLIGFLSLIPIFGAFVGCFIGAFLLLTISPMTMVIFIVIFLVIQQIEGNLIYPYVVGGSVGLPSIWVLAAVTVGGNAMGLTGMIITIPLCSVAYTLLRESVGIRLKNRHIPSCDLGQSGSEILDDVIEKRKGEQPAAGDVDPSK